MTGQLTIYVGMLHRAEQTLAESFQVVARTHAAEAEVFAACRLLAAMSEQHVRLLQPVADRYGEVAAGADVEEPERLHAVGVAEGREGPVGLLRDLQDLQVLGTLVQTTWTVVRQAAQAVRDAELIDLAERANRSTSRQLAWLNTHLKVAAPQALIAGP